MSDNNNQEYFKDTIQINNMVSDNSEDVITIYSRNLHSEFSDNNYSYKLTPDGKVLFNTLIDNINGNYYRDKYSKDKMIDELIKFGFEKIPDNLNESDIRYILQFSISKIEKNITCGRIYPCIVNITETGDLKVILLMYNGNSITVGLENIPFKLKDARNKVVVVKEIDLNKTVNPKKIGIFCININKNNLIEKEMDLSTWSISFER